MPLVHPAGPIPDIHITRIHNESDPECDVHYDTFSRLAEVFGRNTPAHRHTRFFQVHFLTRGSIRLYLDDQFYADEAPLVFLTPPALPHAFYSDDSTDGHVVTVRREVVRDWQAAMPGQWPEAQLRDPAFLSLRHLPAECADEVARLLATADLLRAETAGSGKGRSAALRSLGHYFFISLNRLFAAVAHNPPLKRERGEDLRIFLSFCDLVETHFRSHATLPEYARQLAVTEARLNDVCRRVAGLASKEVVHDRLLQEARRLLRFSATPISELSYQLGFADPAYFSRFFSQRAGMTPSVFRQQHQGGQG